MGSLPTVGAVMETVSLVPGALLRLGGAATHARSTIVVMRVRRMV